MSEICRSLHRLFWQLPKFGFPFDSGNIPRNGIYILFERGESGHGMDRIVRVGTHTGDDQLLSRLEQHYVRENKDRSIFRKHIGRAILNKDKDAFRTQWDIDLTTKAAKAKYAETIDPLKLKDVEKRVTEYVRSHFRFVSLRVDDKMQRLQWESRIISTVSLCEECHPSKDWLGQYSPNVKIVNSGLWLVNELYKQPLSEKDLEALTIAALKAT